MIRIALRMLLGDRLKYAGLVAGLAFAALLITQQASIYYGFTERIGSWVRDTGQADLWVMDPDVELVEKRFFSHLRQSAAKRYDHIRN